MQQGVVGQEVGVEGAGGVDEAQLLALQLRLDVGNHVFDIITQTSDNIGATSSAVDVLRVTVGAVVDGLAGAEELALAVSRGPEWRFHRSTSSLHWSRVATPGTWSRRLSSLKSHTTPSLEQVTGESRGSPAPARTRGSGKQEGEDDTRNEAPHLDEKLGWSYTGETVRMLGLTRTKLLSGK